MAEGLRFGNMLPEEDSLLGYAMQEGANISPLFMAG